MGACGTNCGITRQRDREKDAAVLAMARFYPGLVWRRDAPLPGLAPTFDAIVGLGASLEDILPVRAIPRPGEPGCDWLYLLAGLHRPSLAEVFDGTVALTQDVKSDETYVRIGFSRLGPFVTLQEVRMKAVADAEGTEIVEEPVLGVVDRRLQHIIKGLQGALRKANLVVLDMAFLVEPVAEGRQDEFASAFGGTPCRWSFLFEGTPPTTARAGRMPTVYSSTR